MDTIQNWIGRLRFAALILLHLAGAVVGAGLFLILAVLVAIIFQVKDGGNVSSIAAAFFLTGLILPSILIWRARNRYVRRASPPPLTPEFIRTTHLAMDHNYVNSEATASTEPLSQATSDPPAPQRSRNPLRDVAEYNRARRQAGIEAPYGHETRRQDSYQQSPSSNIHSLLKLSPRRWRWWYTLSTLLSVIVILAVFLPPIGIPIAPSADLEVTRSGVLSADDGNAVEILNEGSKSITITNSSINDRLDCNIDNSITHLLPKELKVGDTMFIASPCKIIRITIESDAGSRTYSFAHE